MTSGWYTITFSQSFGQAPRVVASLASYDGGENAGLRYQGLAAGSVQVKVEEDTTSLDDFSSR